MCIEGYSELGTSASGMRYVECTGDSTQSVVLSITMFLLVLSLPAIYFCIKRRKNKDADLEDFATQYEKDQVRDENGVVKRSRSHGSRESWYRKESEGRLLSQRPRYLLEQHMEVGEADSRLIPPFLLSPTHLPLYFIILSSHYLHLLLSSCSSSLPPNERTEKLNKKRKKANAFLNHVQTPFKILLSYAQIVSGFSFNFGIKFRPFFSSVMSVFSFANLDFVSLTPMGCVVPISYHDQLLDYALLPLIAFAMMLVLYKYLGIKNKGQKASRDAVFNSFLLLTFLVRPTTSTKILNTFACDELNDGRRALKGDLGIDCDSTEHYLYLYYAGS